MIKRNIVKKNNIVNNLKIFSICCGIYINRYYYFIFLEFFTVFLKIIYIFALLTDKYLKSYPLIDSHYYLNLVEINPHCW